MILNQGTPAQNGQWAPINRPSLCIVNALVSNKLLVCAHFIEHRFILWNAPHNIEKNSKSLKGKVWHFGKYQLPGNQQRLQEVTGSDQEGVWHITCMDLRVVSMLLSISWQIKEKVYLPKLKNISFKARFKIRASRSDNNAGVVLSYGPYQFKMSFRVAYNIISNYLYYHKLIATYWTLSLWVPSGSATLGQLLPLPVR